MTDGSVDDVTTTLPIRIITPEGTRDSTDLVVREISATIMLNHRRLVTLTSSPKELEALAVGYLAGRGLIGDRTAIRRLETDREQYTVHIETVSLASDDLPLSKPRFAADYRLAASSVSDLIRQFDDRSQLFRATGGVHGAALAVGTGITLFSEDVSRHSAIDKIIGRCLLDDIPTARSLLITGGRVAADIVPRIARLGVPVIVSRSAPTDRAVALASRLGMTLVGFARDGRMNVYTAVERIIANRGAAS